MTGLHIMHIEDDQLLWVYHGQQGTATILSGRCWWPTCRLPAFLLSQSASMQIREACQTWLDEKPERDRKAREDAAHHNYYHAVWEEWLEVNPMQYAVPSIEFLPEDVIARGQYRFVEYYGGEEGSYRSPLYTDPTWADAMREFDTAIKECEDYHHCFLEGVRVDINFDNELNFCTGS